MFDLGIGRVTIDAEFIEKNGGGGCGSGTEETKGIVHAVLPQELSSRVEQRCPSERSRVGFSIPKLAAPPLLTGYDTRQQQGFNLRTKAEISDERGKSQSSLH